MQGDQVQPANQWGLFSLDRFCDYVQRGIYPPNGVE
jgi:hypothetical protein